MIIGVQTLTDAEQLSVLGDRRPGPAPEATRQAGGAAQPCGT